MLKVEKLQTTQTGGVKIIFNRKIMKPKIKIYSEDEEEKKASETNAE